MVSLDNSARRASALLKAMGNPHRLTILCHLIHSEKSVGELERIVGLSQSALSQHLARLRKDNLVKTRRSAQTIYYSLAGNEAASVLSALYRLYCCDPASPPGAAEEFPPPDEFANAGMSELTAR
jgi:DNA-binding transcriptional ArsR family regulator